VAEGVLNASVLPFQEAPVPVLRRFAPLLAVLAVGTAVVAAVIVSAPDPVQAAPGDPPAEAGVEVQGVGTATGTPDVLHVTVGVETHADSVGEALASANAAAQHVLDALRGAGVADADLQTANVHVYPRYDGDGQSISGYLAGQDIRVTLRDVGAAGATIGSAVQAGGDAARLQGISYELDDDAPLMSRARELAFADARATAEQYARLAGRELGDVVLMREQVTPSGPVAMAGDSAASSQAVPIAPGTTDVTVTAEVRWSFG
jgi:uncharacterized protein YggE